MDIISIMDSYINAIKTIDINTELIIFMLIVTFLLYTRPIILLNFSRTFLGRILLLLTLVFGTMRSTAHGILIAIVIIVFAEHVFAVEGFDTNSMIKTNVSTFISWEEANKLAIDSRGRLPTKDEFQSANINVGSIDMWMPATNGNMTNYWVHVGTGQWALYSTQPGVVNYPPPWGLTNEPTGYRPGPIDQSTINYIYIVKNMPSYSCPEGFTGPTVDGNCTKGWASDCDESCAKDRCGKVGGKWIPLDYGTHPYTCNITPPKPTCSLDP